MSVKLFAHEESPWLRGCLYLYCALENQTNQKATDDHSPRIGHWANSTDHLVCKIFCLSHFLQEVSGHICV